MSVTHIIRFVAHISSCMRMFLQQKIISLVLNDGIE